MTKTIRNIFLVLFILSTIIGCGLLVTTFGLRASQAPTTAPPVPSPGPFESESFAVVSSFAASLASLIGFVTTTAITWRKEKRESDLAKIERKKLQLELEKSKLELEELKREKKK